MPFLIMHPTVESIAYYQYENDIWLIFYRYSGIIEKIQDAICRELNFMTDKYQRVKTILFNLHVNSYSDNNKVISLFMKSYIKKLERKYKSHIGYIWVREQANSINQHYHIAIFIDGKKCQSSWTPFNMAKETWEENQKSGTIKHIINGSYTINRSDRQSLQIVILRLSYYAKKRTKQKSSIKMKSFHTSHNK